MYDFFNDYFVCWEHHSVRLTEVKFLFLCVEEFEASCLEHLLLLCLADSHSSPG